MRGRSILAILTLLSLLLSGCGAQTPWGWAAGLEDSLVSHVTRWGPGVREELTDAEIRCLLSALRGVTQADCETAPDGAPVSAKYGLTLYCADGQYALLDAGDGRIGLSLGGCLWHIRCPEAYVLLRRSRMPGAAAGLSLPPGPSGAHSPSGS